MISSLFLVAFLSLAAEAQKQVCLITAPYVVHVGVEETISVQLHGATKPVSVDLYFKPHKEDKLISEMQHVLLNDANRYQAIVKLKVDPLLYNDQRKQSKDKYIQLVAANDLLFKKKKYANILVSTRRGYIFIQTDKPIYNPGEKVQYRVFTLDNYMRPTDDTILVQIFNCKGLLVYSHILRSNQILDRSIAIPNVELAGHWKITASFSNYGQPVSSVEFEVREYVLPLFEVNIKATQPYHTLSDDIFQFNISARYTYGKGVDGTAHIRFGLVDNTGERTYLPGTEKQAAVEDGHVNIIVLTSELESAAANQNKPHIEGFYLYIAATVLEKASGDLEEAESSSVKIVTSPYVVDLSKTKKYFSPGGKFSIRGTTTYPDGSRVPHLKIKATITVNPQREVLTAESTGDHTGDIAISIEVPKQAETMFITVTAEGGHGEVIVSDAKIEVTAIVAAGQSYLSVEVPPQVLQPGQQLQVTFRDITASAARPSHIYYLLMSKGRFLRAEVVKRTALTSVSLAFSMDMVPSFRLIAYYYTEDSSIVADSVWVDVKDVCEGKVEIVPFADLKPAQQFEVSVRTDADSTVALSAVDSAVYVLNKKNKLSPQKVFDHMNSYDLGCSVGGGNDSRSVLEGAGLTFICNCGTNASVIAHHVCYNKPHRQKRDLQYSKLINSFKHPDRKCCDDGRKLTLAQGKSCDERLKRTAHQTESCRQAFKRCCEATVAQRKNARRRSQIRHLGRSSARDISVEDMIDEAAIHLRSYFPQSWMWVLMQPHTSGDIRYRTVAPDSITTWEVQAVSISPTKGFCVADPQPLRVFQDFFVSVKLPYSVKKNEQLELKAVIYNYKQESLEVTVKMEKVEGLCTAGGGDVVEKVSLAGQSATAVYFTVVPLVIGSLPINVLAYASELVSDRVQKELRVVGEGELVSVHMEHNVDTRSDKTLEFHLPDPDDKVPGQDSATYMSFKGGVMGESVDNCLNIEGVDQLIQLPTGCAEQTMVKMSPAIHAISYLDATNQWLYLKSERREEAKAMIQAGYNRVLTYKKTDGSYGAFLNTPSSVWLTAFIAKELTGSRDIIEVQDFYIQEAMSYLMSKQKETGSWDDPNPLYDKGMKGGVGQTEDATPLTAFILISMIHAKQVYGLGTDTKLILAMNKATSYLVEHLDAIENSYAMAITAYALSLHKPQSTEAQQAHRNLMQMATCDKDQCFWEARGKEAVLGKKADALSVEATAYGLLHAVALQDKSTAGRAAAWLTQQRKYGGGFRSTQDTVVALEALSKFSIQNNDVDDLDLKVEMCVNSKHAKNLHLTKSNALTQAAVQIKETGKVAVSVKGQGIGTLSIVQTYRSLKKDESHCDHFHISVQVDGELVLKSQEEGEQYDDYYNYEAAEDEDEDEERREEPLREVDWLDLRSRRRRHAPEEPRKESTLVYTVCLGLKKENSSSMVVVDISLLSGLMPNIQDLEDNAKGTEKYIDHYDFHRNKVFLYFNQISETEECVRFRVDQIIPVGLVQPAAAVIYDYYSPERRCGIFYTAPKSSDMLKKLCKGEVCTCAEGACARSRVTFSKSMEPDTRKRYACYAPSVDYIYTMKILNSSDDAVFTTYSTLITKVLQTGTKDVVVLPGAYREMTQRLTCDDVQLKNNAEYLIMGDDNAIFLMNEAHRKFLYILDNKMWIEEIPHSSKCKASRNKQACQLLQSFMEDYFLNKCSI
ncbi:complement C4-A [Brachyhypopomus gauderio]|uniref:complement C4-A n=1 Tax=Brachyhypopomus gauderio TaxID=698409 RepID=UPI00404291DF